MTDELKSALKRLRTSNYPSDESGGIQYELDKIAIAKAYLAEHPVDEDEPIDAAWWISTFGGKHCEIDHQFALYLCLDGIVQLYVEEPNDRAYSMDLPHIKTRGDARRLVAVLGVTLGESHDRP